MRGRGLGEETYRYAVGEFGDDIGGFLNSFLCKIERDTSIAESVDESNCKGRERVSEMGEFEREKWQRIIPRVYSSLKGLIFPMSMNNSD